MSDSNVNFYFPISKEEVYEIISKEIEEKQKEELDFLESNKPKKTLINDYDSINDIPSKFFIEYLKKEGFGEMVDYIKENTNFSNNEYDRRYRSKHIYLNYKSQQYIDKNISKGRNDYIKSGVTYYIKDYVNLSFCRALILVEDENFSWGYGGDKKLVKALIKVSQPPPGTLFTREIIDGKVKKSPAKYKFKDILWDPVIEFLISGLNKGDTNCKREIYNFIVYMCDNLNYSTSRLMDDYFNYDSVEYSNIIKSCKSKINTKKIPIHLYFSLLKETMILEEKRYPNGTYGKRMPQCSYYDLAISGTDYKQWRINWHFDEDHYEVF